MTDKCKTCNKVYSTTCDWQQGRCPNHKPLTNMTDKISIQPRDTSPGHFYASIAKSALRIIAGLAFIQGMVIMGGALLIAAEVLGIIEELV